MRIYIDGNLDSITNLSYDGTIQNPNSLLIGACDDRLSASPAVKNFFKGTIDEMRISMVARSSQEIAQYWSMASNHVDWGTPAVTTNSNMILFDDFENNTIGNYPNGWTVDLPNGDIIITNDRSTSSSKSVKFTLNAHGVNGPDISKNFGFHTNAFCIKVNLNTSHFQNLVLSLRNSISGNAPVGVFFQKDHLYFFYSIAFYFVRSFDHGICRSFNSSSSSSGCKTLK